MEIELINPYIVKILLAARPEDSINSISKRIGLSYGWTYKWAKELVQMGVFKEINNKIIPQENHHFYKKTIEYIKHTFGNDVGFYYSVLVLFGIKYAFTKTDAVFVWTKGGYNIGRSKEYYPIFIKVKTMHKNLFEYCCRKLDLKINTKKGVFYVIEFIDEFALEYSNGIPVDPLNITIDFMKKYVYNFQPALEMIAEMYKKKTGINYKEVAVYV